MYKSVVVLYEGEKLLGNVDVSFSPESLRRGLRHKISGKVVVSHLSKASDRCLPLAVLHTITNGKGVSLKMECRDTSNYLMHFLYNKCLQQNKTAVVALEDEELHLVAMRSTENSSYSYFWGFIVAPGLYESCCVMLNRRCLGIVVDLDETLIFANTLRSLVDRIGTLKRKINDEVDLKRVAGMQSVLKRYEDDRHILKQFAESDQVVINGKLIKAQPEVVPPLTENHRPLVRPLIRLHDKSMILTRINPSVSDTSVLVRLRPGWNDLRSYLTGGRQKRFEVYVCTMGEREYALEMWRLLDPNSYLIKSKELLNRIVCVKPGLKKSLSDVFHDGEGHPRMTLVIDDRMKVWDEKDQHRVHAVSSFAPCYAPQAEVNSDVPILCVARDVACNVRGGFFKDFDNGFSQQIAEVAHENDIKDIMPPDVSNYLTSETSNTKFPVEPENDIKDIVPPDVSNYLTSENSNKNFPVAPENDTKDIVPPDVSNYLTSENSNEKFRVSPENDIKDIIPPDVSNYLTSEKSKKFPVAPENEIKNISVPDDAAAALNGNRELPVFNGLADELEKGSQAIEPRPKTLRQQNPTPKSGPFVRPKFLKPLVQYTRKKLPEGTPNLQHVTEVKLPEITTPTSVPSVPPTIPKPVVKYIRRKLSEETPILKHVTQVDLPETAEQQIPASSRRDARLKTASQQNPAPISVPFVQPPIPKPTVQYTLKQLPEETRKFQHVTEVSLPETTAPISVPFIQATIQKPTVQYTLKQLPEETLKLQHDLPETTAPILVSFVQPTIPKPIVQYTLKQLPKETRKLQHVTQVNLPETSLHGSPEREEGELLESDSDDMRRRFLVLQHEGDEDRLEKLLSRKRDRGGIQGDGRDAYVESPAEYLHKISVKSGNEVEFRKTLVPSTELLFSTEVMFSGENIGEGIGKTRKEAHHHAAMESLKNLAENYTSVLESGTACVHGDGNSVNESDEVIFSDGKPSSPESEPASDSYSRKEGSNKGTTKTLIELCMKKGLNLRFQQPPHRWSSTDVYAEAEIDGEVMGKGKGPTWDDAKMQAASWAIKKMTSPTRKYPQKRRSSSRSYQGSRCKHSRRESSRLRQRVPSPAA